MLMLEDLQAPCKSLTSSIKTTLVWFQTSLLSKLMLRSESSLKRDNNKLALLDTARESSRQVKKARIAKEEEVAIMPIIRLT